MAGLAQLPSQSLPISLLKAVSDPSPPSGPLREEKDALDLLEGLGLLERTGRSFSIPDAAREQVNEALDFHGVNKGVETALALLLTDLPARPTDFENWGLLEKLLEPVRAVIERAVAIELHSQNGAFIMAKVSEYLTARGHFDEAEDFARSAYAMAPSAPPQALVASMSCALGSVLVELGALHEAREAFEQALAAHLDSEEKDEDGLQCSRLALGEVLGELGEIPTARELVESALRDHPNKFDRVKCRAQRRLAWLLVEEERLDEAEQEYRDALDATEQRVGADHPESALVRGELGAMLLERDDWEEARQELEEALSVAQKTLGADHPAVGVILSNLGGALEGLGKAEEARTHLERALEIGEAALPEGHRNLWLRHRKLSRVLRSLGDFDAARHQAETAVAISERALGSEDIEAVRDQLVLAELLAEAGRAAVARERYEQALPALRGELGHNSLEVARHQFALGRLQSQLGVLGQARNSLQQALLIFEKEDAAAQGLSVRLELFSLVEKLGDELGATLEAVDLEKQGMDARGRYRATRQESLERVLDKADFTSALAVAGAVKADNPDLALKALHKAQSLAEQVGDADDRELQIFIVGLNWSSLGFDAYRDSNHELARTAYQGALTLADGLSAEGEALHDLGDVELAAQRPREAISLYRQAHDKRQEAGETEEAAYTLLMLGRAYEADQNFEGAEAAFAERLDLLRLEQGSDPLAEGVTLHYLANVRLSLERPDEAIKLYEEALQLKRASGNTQEIAATMVAIARMQRQVGTEEAALKIYEECLETLRSMSERDWNAEAVTLEEIAEIHRDRGEPRDASDRYREVADSRRLSGDGRGSAFALLTLSGVLKELKEPAAAEAASLERLSILQSLDEDLGWQEGITLHSLGDLRRMQGDMSAAIDYYHQAVDLLRTADMSSGLEVTLHNLGSALSREGRHAEAIEAYEESAALFRELGQTEDEALVLQGLGRVLVNAERFTEAEEAFRERLRILQDLPVGDLNQEGITRHDLAGALVSQEKSEEAAELLRDAVSLKKEAGNVIGAARSLVALAATDAAVDQKRAFETAEEAVDIFRQVDTANPSELAAGIALMAILDSDPVRARSLLEESEEIVGSLPPDEPFVRRASEALAQAREKLQLESREIV